MVGTTMFSSDKECLNNDTQGDSDHSGKYSDVHDADLRVQLMCIDRALCHWIDGRNIRIRTCRSRVNFRTTVREEIPIEERSFSGFEKKHCSKERLLLANS